MEKSVSYIQIPVEEYLRLKDKEIVLENDVYLWQCPAGRLMNSAAEVCPHCGKEPGNNCTGKNLQEREDELLLSGIYTVKPESMIDSSGVNTEYINDLISKSSAIDAGKISNGYHTFNELYSHSNMLFIKLCWYVWNFRNSFPESFNVDDLPVWRSRNYSSGKPVEQGWFLMGINAEVGKQITYHLPEKYWIFTAWVKTVHLPPAFDGHTPEDVLQRLVNL